MLKYIFVQKIKFFMIIQYFIFNFFSLFLYKSVFMSIKYVFLYNGAGASYKILSNKNSVLFLNYFFLIFIAFSIFLHYFLKSFKIFFIK